MPAFGCECAVPLVQDLVAEQLLDASGMREETLAFAAHHEAMQFIGSSMA